MVRIAKVKATGQRYIVQQLDFRSDQAHCWGEVLVADSRKGLRHEGSKSFGLNQVEISKDTLLTQALMDELFEQSVQAHKADIEAGKLKLTVSKHRK